MVISITGRYHHHTTRCPNVVTNPFLARKLLSWGVGGFVNLLIVKKPLLSLFVLAVSDSDLNYRRFRYTSEQVGMGEEERE